MKKCNVLVILLVCGWQAAMAQFSIEDLQEKARQNNPLAKQFELIEKSNQYTVNNLKLKWLPQVSALGQATYQSDVSAWPESMQPLLAGMGAEMDGMSKFQYKVGVDVNQTIWEGGRIAATSKVAKMQTEVLQAQNEVNLYVVKKRVNDLFFSVLLIDERLKVNRDMQSLLQSNVKQMQSMVANGVAMQSDVDALKVELINARQNETEMLATKTIAMDLLSQLCGTQIDSIQAPTINVQNWSVSTGGDSVGARPEFALIESSNRLAQMQEKQLKSGLMPTVSVFASGYYGYPGYNMFESIMEHENSLNGIVGARISWNISNFYTNKNDKSKLMVQRQMNENQRETFLFNNSLEQTNAQRSIDKYRLLIEQDNEIVTLRENVRKATEKKLANGVVDSNKLVEQIMKENSARNNKTIHQVELLNEMYNLQYTKGL